MDDSKVSHPEQSVVEGVIKELEAEFRNISVTRGKSHNFVGMDFELTENGEVKIIMRDYLTECIATFGEKFNGGAKTPFWQICSNRRMRRKN